MREREFAIAINREAKGKLPATAGVDVWRKFNGRFRNEFLTMQQVSASIRDGFAYTTHHAGYRRAENFIQGQHIGLDMDTEDERSSIDVLIDDPLIRSHASILHTTPSHRPDAPRARVIFMLEQPIAHSNTYALLAQALVDRYRLADSQCKDPCRVFFGAPDCELLFNGKVLSLMDAKTELVDPYKHKLETIRKECEQMHAGRSPINVEIDEDRLARYVEKAAEAEFEQVSNTLPGSRHGSILAAAIRLGSLMKAEWIPEDAITSEEIVNLLMDAAKINGEVREYGEANVLKTIIDGIEYADPRPPTTFKEDS